MQFIYNIWFIIYIPTGHIKTYIMCLSISVADPWGATGMHPPPPPKIGSTMFFLIQFLSECLKVPRNPTNFAFICTQVGLILDIFLFFVCKKHYFEK